jgi:hypothetical protein
MAHKKRQLSGIAKQRHEAKRARLAAEAAELQEARSQQAAARGTDTGSTDAVERCQSGTGAVAVTISELKFAYSQPLISETQTTPQKMLKEGRR